MSYSKINFKALQTLYSTPAINLLVSILLTLPAIHICYAEDSQLSQSANPEATQCLPEPLSSWKRGAYQLHDSRDNWSERVDSFARGVDHFFVGNSSLSESNHSYARLRVGGKWSEGGQYIDETDLKFRLDLPATKRYYKLIIENDSDEDLTLEEQNRPNFIGNQQSGLDSLSAALQYAETIHDNWKTKARIGIKGGLPLDVFTRFTLKRRWTPGYGWNLPYHFRLSYFHSDGYKAHNSLSFEHPLPYSLFFTAKSAIAWTQERNTMESAQTFSIFQHINENKGINYRVGILGESASHTLVSAYFLSAHYRRLIYEDWLYVDIIPEINYSREFDYEAKSSITLRLEVFFQK